MTDERLLDRVRALRAQRYTPAEIARALALSKREAVQLVRMVAAEAAAGPVGSGTAGDRVRCWVNPGWRNGLRVDADHDWPADGGAPSEADDSGVAVVLVATSAGGSAFEMCCFLVDTWCLGVKNSMGPRRMRARELEETRRRCYAPWRSNGVAVPLELAQHLVLGAVEFARGLGFEPHPDFRQAQPALGSWTGPSAITFGMDGKPHYINGPYDDPERVLRTLERSVGRDGFHYTVSVGEADDLDDGYRYSAVVTDRETHLSDAA